MAENPAKNAQSIEIDWTTEPPPVHANYVYVHVLPQEAILVFSDVAPFPGRVTDEGRTLLSRIVSSLRLPVIFFFHSLVIMASQWNKHVVEQMKGAPGTKLPRFVLIDPPEGVTMEGVEDIKP